MSAFVRETEYGGYSVKAANLGWVVKTWSRISGTLTGCRYHVRYGAMYNMAPLHKSDCLTDAWNESMSIGDAVATTATGGNCHVIKRGTVVQ